MVTSLSNFFRSSLSKGRDIITLGEEEIHVRSYLEIQQARYRDILRYEIRVQPELRGCVLPKLTLQPLVENALYHGIKLRRGMGCILVDAAQEGESVRILVRDDGAGMTPERLRQLRQSLDSEEQVGFGVRTVYRRLRLMYAEHCSMELESEPAPEPRSRCAFRSERRWMRETDDHAFCTLALLVLGGCQPGVRQTPEEERTLITVGFSQVGAESDWRVANTESMRQSLSEENGFELLFDNARQKQENQFKAIRTFIQQDVDYIVLAPVTENGWESVLEEARAARIPVILVDRQVEVDDPLLYTSWVGSDFRKTADEAVAWLAETLDAADKDGEVVQIMHLQGTPGSTAQLQRSAALEAGVAAHENWTITAQLNGDFTQAKAYEVTNAYLRDNRRRTLSIVRTTTCASA